jgi:hypothetical protein
MIGSSRLRIGSISENTASITGISVARSALKMSMSGGRIAVMSGPTAPTMLANTGTRRSISGTTAPMTELSAPPNRSTICPMAATSGGSTPEISGAMAEAIWPNTGPSVSMSGMIAAMIGVSEL